MTGKFSKFWTEPIQRRYANSELGAQRPAEELTLKTQARNYSPDYDQLTLLLVAPLPVLTLSDIVERSMIQLRCCTLKGWSPEVELSQQRKVI